jgi:alpha-N-arabinofuranosidase
LTVVELRLGGDADQEVSSGLFGGFVEHFGTGLYGGLWDLEANGPRADVMAAVKAMGVTALRYPGGCFSDWYHWRDGVGEAAQRPRYERTYWTGLEIEGLDIPRELAERFGPPEPNAVGTDEFLSYCVGVGAEPMLAVNFGTGTPQEAADWVAYVNRRSGSPRKVRWWGIGNEIYGHWELGHCSAAEYGRRFRAFATAMRAVDPEIQLMAVGSADRGRNHPGWNEEVLSAAGDDVDLLSLHFYFPGAALGRQLADTQEEVRQLLLGPSMLGKTLDHALAEVDAVRPGLPVALDEWALWSDWSDLLSRNHRLCESIFFGGCLNRLIERAGRVRFAMISHLVNCMATIQTSGPRMHVTAGYLTFQLYRRHVRGFALPVEVEGPSVQVPPFAEFNPSGDQALGGTGATSREVGLIDAAATRDADGTTIFACSAALDEPTRARIHGLSPGARGRAISVSGPSPFAQNEFDAPDRLGFAETDCAADSAGTCTVELPPATVTALAFGR